MNKRITKKEAVRKHRAMWNWIADYIEKKKEEQCILSCCDPGGIYRKCIDALTWEEQAEIARQIANLSEREDDPEIDIL